MGRFLLGHIFGTISVASVVGMMPPGQAEKVIKQYTNAGYTIAKELAGK